MSQRVCLSGDLNLQTLKAVKARLEHCSGRVLLDLSQVEDLDLSALAWLMSLESRLRAQGGALEIVAASPCVRRSLALMRPATAILRGRQRPLSIAPAAPELACPVSNRLPTRV